jgi:DNA-binding ferritin-like protein
MGRNHSDGMNSKLQVLLQPNIGRDNDVCQAVVEILKITLADEAVLTTKTRCAHRNLSRPGFIEL